MVFSWQVEDAEQHETAGEKDKESNSCCVRIRRETERDSVNQPTECDDSQIGILYPRSPFLMSPSLGMKDEKGLETLE